MIHTLIAHSTGAISRWSDRAQYKYTDMNQHGKDEGWKGLEIMEIKCNSLTTCVRCSVSNTRAYMYDDDEMTRYTREYVDYVWEFHRNEANQTFLNSFDIERSFAHSYFIFHMSRARCMIL